MAQLDPSIIAGVKIPNFGETYGNALLAGSKIASNRAKAESEQAKIDRQNKYQQALTAPIPQGMTRRDALAQQGFLQEALELDKTEGEADKLKAEGGIKSQEHLQKQVESVGQVLQRLVSRPDLSKATAKAELDASYSAGLIAPNLYQKAISTLETIPEEGLRAHIQSQVQALQSAKDQMSYISPDANAQLQAQTSTQNAQLGAQTTMRGQDLGYDMNTQELGLKRQGQEFSQQMDVNKFGLDTAKHQASLNPQAKMSEAQKKQVIGVQNTKNAIQEYRDQLKGFGVMDLASPDARAAMGTKYNNMMLQAKEAYNLGVLNGPDFEILQSVITNPTSLKGAVTSKEALDKQAAELDRIMTQIQGVAGGDLNAPRQSPGWDDNAINAEAQKRGVSPDIVRKYLQKRGQLQ